MKSCPVNDLKHRLEMVEERIQLACQSVNRRREEIQLIVVTKRRTPTTVASMIHFGIKDIGENYVQEIIDKQAALDDLADNFRWHLIGPLQRKKARYLPYRIAMMHSIDRLEVAQALDSIFVKANLKLPGMLQVNVSGETSKSGWLLPDGKLTTDFLAELETIFALPGIKISGLMTMPPYSPDSGSSRSHYVSLRKLADRLNQHFQQPIFTDFSIGTSFDFEVAIEEGATYVRIGEAILGPRE